VLNLLEALITEVHGSALVFRFDPWIVSGREDLIARFFADLTSVIKKCPGAKRELLDLADKLSEYGDEISGVVAPISSTLEAGLKLVTRLARKRSGETLHEKKNKIAEKLRKVTIPLVVMIDDLDRLDDKEVQAMAQLVRSVADFPQISYVLAYDELRVVQALGAGQEDALAYGRAYLEKIVQLQIPLPLTLPEEMRSLLAARFEVIAEEGAFAPGWRSHPRFGKLLDVLEGVIQTPRDIQRLIGSVQAREAMLRGEVSWIDVIGLCALELKAPDTVAGLRINYEYVITDASLGRRMLASSRNESIDRRIERIVPEHERKEPVLHLLHFLFPAIRGAGERDTGSPDAVSLRRPLLTALRLGLLPGGVRRAEVYEFLRGSKDRSDYLRQLVRSGVIEKFLDRLEDVYLDAPEVEEGAVWLSLGELAEKRLDGQSFANERDSSIGDILFRLVMKADTFRPRAASIVEGLVSSGLLHVPTFILREHMDGLGLFGSERPEMQYLVLPLERVVALVERIGYLMRERMADPTFMSRLANGRPFALMVHSKLWKEEDKKLLRAALERTESLDSFVGISFSEGKRLSSGFIEALIGEDELRALVSERMRREDYGLLPEDLSTAYDRIFQNTD
jgi:hypothetical protein